MNRIYYIANVRMPTEKAHGIQIMKMCEAFANQGMSVELWVPTRRTFIKEDPYEYYQVKNNFKIRRIWCLDLVKFGKVGFWIETLTFSKFVSLLALFKKGTFYTRDEVCAVYLKFILKKVIWEAHMGHTNMWSKYLIKCNSKIVVISKGLKDLYVKNGAREGKIIVAPDAVNLQEFVSNVNKIERRKILSLPIDKKIIMYAGLLDKWKGVDTLLEASSYFSEHQLLIIGGKNEEIESLKKIYPQVIFLGFKPYSELPENQIVADILVIPNSGKEKISSLYTSPIKLFAHMASGVPLLVSDLPSLHEIVDESMVTFFEADNAQDLSMGVRKIFDNYFEALNKAHIAQEEVKKYTWDIRAKQILQFIK